MQRLDFSSVTSSEDGASTLAALFFAALASRFCPRFIVRRYFQLMHNQEAVANPLYDRPESLQLTQQQQLKKRLLKVQVAQLGYSLMVGWSWELVAVSLLKVIMDVSRANAS